MSNNLLTLFQRLNMEFIYLEITRKRSFKKWFSILILCLFFILSVVSIGQGFVNAYTHSQDYQWSPTVILSHRDNPYQVFLNGDPEHKIILSQQPNYLHSLYILLLPLSGLNWETAKIVWALFNFVFATLSIFMVSKIFKLPKVSTFLLALLFYMSTPFRNGLGNGQHQELVLFLFLWGASATHIGTGAFLTGMSYFKYSFAPAIAQFFWLRRGTKALFLSFLVPILGVTIFSLIVHDNPIMVAFQPFIVSANGNAPGQGDLMTILENILRENSLNNQLLEKSIIYLLPLILSLVVGFIIHTREKNIGAIIAYTGLSSLMFLRHLNYDYVFLLPMAAIALTNGSKIKRAIIGLGIAYHWYILKLISYFSIDTELLLLLTFFVNLCMLVTIFNLSMKKQAKSDTSHLPSNRDSLEAGY